MVFCLTKQGNEMTGFCPQQSQGLKASAAKPLAKRSLSAFQGAYP